MKKTISILSVFMLILTMLFLFAGCSNKSVEESKEIVAEYYDSFAGNDAKDILDLFDDSFIDYLGGGEDAEIIMASRIAVLGEDLEYNIYGTSYNKDESGVFVIIEVEAEYERDGESYDEKFQLEEIDGEMLITQVSFDREKVIDELPEKFVKVYNDGDEDALPGLFADAYFDYFGEDYLYSMMDNFWLALGSLEGIELTEEYAYALDMEDGAVLVQEGYYDAEFENGSALIWMELCNEGGEILIYDFFLIPDLVQSTVDEHYAMMQELDYEGVADMYQDVFYEYTDGGRAGWIEILEAVSSYGEYAGNEITYWEYYETELDGGAMFTGISASVNSQFGDTVFYNEITISLDPEDPGIIGHTIEIGE